MLEKRVSDISLTGQIKTTNKVKFVDKQDEQEEESEHEDLINEYIMNLTRKLNE